MVQKHEIDIWEGSITSQETQGTDLARRTYFWLFPPQQGFKDELSVKESLYPHYNNSFLVSFDIYIYQLHLNFILKGDPGHFCTHKQVSRLEFYHSLLLRSISEPWQYNMIPADVRPSCMSRMVTLCQILLEDTGLGIHDVLSRKQSDM